MLNSNTVLISGILLVFAACGAPPENAGGSATATLETQTEVTAAAPTADDGPALFVDAAADTGLAFTHWNGMTGEYYYSEMMGSGAALFDYDNDGDLDVYLVQGNLQGAGETAADATFPPPTPCP